MFIRKYFYLNDEPAADTGSAPAPAPESTPAPPPDPVPAPTDPQPVAAKLTDEDIDRIVIRLKGQPEESEKVTEPDMPEQPTEDPRDQTMRSLLIKANQVPESLVALLPKDPTATQTMIESKEFQALMARERQAAQINQPDPNAPKPKAPEGDANTAPVQPKTFADITADHLNEISAYL